MRKTKCTEKSRTENKRRRPSSGKKPEKGELLKLYIQESRSIRVIAQALGDI